MSIQHAIYVGMAAALMSTSAMADTGYMSKQINVPHREEPIRLDIYFPSSTGGEITMHGANPVFTGIELVSDAQPATGRFPVVLFSHGSGGNGINTGWIGKAIAEQGMIFIAPNHPGTTSRDSHPEETIKTWERPQDLSSIIDQLPQIFDGAMQADEQNIGAIGFSLGGYSVLATAGALVDKQAFLSHCEQSMGAGLNECGWLTRNGLDLNTVDEERFEQSNFEPRIKAAVSVDPGFAAAFDTASLSAMERPVHIINLGTDETLYDGINAKAVAAQIPNADYHQIAGSFHFSFLGTCTPQGEAILKAEREDPICTEPHGGVREHIHAEIASQVTTFFAAHLQQ